MNQTRVLTTGSNLTSARTILATGALALGAVFAHGGTQDTHPTVWSADGLDGTITVFDRVSGDQLDTLTAGGNPHVLELSPDGRYVYAVNAGAHDLPADEHEAHHAGETVAPGTINSLWVYASDSGEVLARIPVGSGPTHPIPSPDGALVYVTNTDEGSVSVIDTATWQVVETIEDVAEPHDGAVTPDGNSLLLATAGEDTVTAIDTRTLEITARYPVGTKPRGLVIDPSGTTAYASNKGDGTVSAIDLVTSEIRTLAVGAEPHGLDLSPDGGTLFAALSGANAVAGLDVATGEVLARIPVGAQPEQLDVSADGAWLAASNAADRTLTLVDLTRMQAVRSLPTGAGNFGVLFSNAPFVSTHP